jgi:hypothetical protein
LLSQRALLSVVLLTFHSPYNVVVIYQPNHYTGLTVFVQAL